MKNQTRLIYLTVLLLSSLAASSARAEDTLWNLTFKDLKPGDALKEMPYSAGCPGPQKVTTTAQDTLAGAPTVGTLVSPLLFDKETNANYTPSFTLKGTSPITSGVVTINMDILFDRVSPTAANPVETLMAMPFINGDGGANQLIIGGAGLKKWATPPTFQTGTAAHLKMVLDLNQHTFQAFLNDAPMGDPEQDPTKFSSFLGFTVRDGTALGGNKGATFTAGIGNLVVTHS